MTTTLSYVIVYVATYSRIVSVGVSLWNWPFLRRGVRLFALLELVGLCFTVYSSVQVGAGNNTYLSYLSLATDALFMSLIYGPLMPSPGHRRAAWAFGPLFALGTLIDYRMGEGPRQLGPNYVSAIECALVSVLLAGYLNGQFNREIPSLRRDPMTLISVCLLAISVIALPVYALSPALMSYSMTLTMRAYDLMFLSALIAHLGYAYAFWLTRPLALSA